MRDQRDRPHTGVARAQNVTHMPSRTAPILGPGHRAATTTTALTAVHSHRALEHATPRRTSQSPTMRCRSLSDFVLVRRSRAAARTLAARRSRSSAGATMKVHTTKSTREAGTARGTRVRVACAPLSRREPCAMPRVEGSSRTETRRPQQDDAVRCPPAPRGDVAVARRCGAPSPVMNARTLVAPR